MLIEVVRLVEESDVIECPWCGGGGIIISLGILGRDKAGAEKCRECAGNGLVDGTDPENQKKARLRR